MMDLLKFSLDVDGKLFPEYREYPFTKHWFMFGDHQIDLGVLESIDVYCYKSLLI